MLDVLGIGKRDSYSREGDDAQKISEKNREENKRIGKKGRGEKTLVFVLHYRSPSLPPLQSKSTPVAEFESQAH